MSSVVLCPYCLGEVNLPQQQCPFCGKAFTNRNPAGALAFGTQLAEGRYTIGDYVAADGEGLTYRAVDNEAAIFLTIKEFFPVTLCSGRTRSGIIQPKAGAEVLFKTTRMDFQDLYTTLQRITPAEGLVPVLDVLQANNTVYAVMENAKGVTLSRYLQLHSRRPMKAQEVLDLLDPVLQGVEYLHKHGIMHRGICPDNILLPIDGGACLTGYATLGLRTAGGELKPKLYAGYSAPEQYSANEFEGFYTDVYALSAVFYRTITGKVPIPAPQRLAGEELAAPHLLDPSIPVYFSQVVGCGLRTNPQKRIQTVEELADALANQNEATAMLQKNRSKEGVSTMRLLGVFAVLVVLLVLLVLFIVLHLPDVSSVQKEETTAATTEPTTTEADSTIVPNFVGQLYTDIRANEDYLSRFRFAITEVADENSPSGTVLNQEPAEGTLLEEGTKATIKLTISKGNEEIEMPNIIGYTQADAVEVLDAAGIPYRIMEMVNTGDYAAGCVAYCDKSAGNKIDPKTTTVCVYIASEVQATATPLPDSDGDVGEVPTDGDTTGESEDSGSGEDLPQAPEG